MIQVISAYFLWLRLVSSWKRLGNLYYNFIYLSRIETLSGYKGSAVSPLVIIRLASTKANSYSNFVTHSFTDYTTRRANEMASKWSYRNQNSSDQVKFEIVIKGKERKFSSS